MDDYEKLMEKKQEKYMVGITIAIALFVFTIGEFMLGDAGASDWGNVFLLIASLKAYLVIRDYMHIGRIFISEEEH